MCLHVGKRLDCYYHTEYLLKYLDVFSFSVFLFVSFFFFFTFQEYHKSTGSYIYVHSSVGWFGLAADKLKVFWVFFCREMECNRVYNRQRGNQ